MVTWSAGQYLLFGWTLIMYISNIYWTALGKSAFLELFGGHCCPSTSPTGTRAAPEHPAALSRENLPH